MYFDFNSQPGKTIVNRGLNTSGTALMSIITPYYNAGEFFEQTFNCVLNQTFAWFEWIIVDDGSRDERSIDVLNNLSRRDGRIKVLRQENQGQAAARNFAAANSQTDILVPLDADDLIAPTFLEKLYWALHFNADAAWAYTDSVGFGNQEYLWRKPFSALRMKTENFLVCTAAIRKTAFDRVGGYDASARHYDEDWSLWLRLLAKGEFPVHVNGYSFWYRRSTGGMQNTVQTDYELRKRSKELIEQCAANVREEVCAVEYPRASTLEKYRSPRVSDWGRKVFSQHTKTHVMLLLPWMEMGGADLFNLDICRKINKDRFEISVLTTVPAENSWQQQFEEHVTDIFNLPDFLDVENYPEFISYMIKSRDIDVLFLSNSYYGYYLVPWLRKEFPDLAIIDYVHMEEWYWRNGGYARTSGAMGEILEKTYVCNERTRRVLIRDFRRAPESVETLYIGVDRETFDAAKVEKGQVRKALGIDDHRPVVLFPCRIHPQKRPFLMLEIAKQLRIRIPDVAFVVVGDGPQFEELRLAVQRDGLSETVYLAGREEDVRPYYADCDLTLICSLKEGLALTAYESLAMGKPVVTSDVGGQAELIDETVGRVLPLLQSEADGLDDRDFPEDEVAQYVDAITELLSDEENYGKLCRNCRERIEKQFSSQIMIDKLEQIFIQLGSEQNLAARRQISRELGKYSRMVGELPAVFGEIEGYEAMYKNAYSPDMKNELMRIANSKWGSRLIKLAFQLKLNRIFR